MDGKQMIDRAIFIIARGDVDRDQLLFYMNEGMRTEMHGKTLTRFIEGKNLTANSGMVSVPSLKNVKMVRWISEDSMQELQKLSSLIDAYVLYNSITDVGIPSNYVHTQQSLQIIPVPKDTDTIFVLGEFWPDDLQDSASSTNIFATEAPMAMVYLGAAEYLDFLQEEKRGDYWRQKGQYVLNKWLTGLVNQELTAINNMPRDPLGSLGINQRKRTTIIETFRNNYGVDPS